MKRRVAAIFIIGFVVVAGFLIGRATGDSMLPAGLIPRREYPLPPAPPSPEPSEEEQMDTVEEHLLIVETPSEGSEIGLSFTVAGRADERIARIAVAVTDEDGARVADEVVTMPRHEEFARFSVPLTLSVPEGSGLRLAVQATDVDGAMVEEVRRSLAVRREGYVTVKAYFQNDSLAGDVCETTHPVLRSVPADAAIYRSAIEALLEGPTEEEIDDGYATSLPTGVELKDIAADAEGVVKANFTDRLDRGVAGSCRVTAIRTQITETLSQFPEVRDVIIAVEGETEEVLQP